MTFTVSAAQFVAAPYNCPTDGTSNCRPAFLAFKAAAQGLDSVLNVPAGHTYKILAFTGGETDDQSFIFAGIPNLVIDAGAGATINAINNIGWGVPTGINTGVGTCSARTQTALANQTTITLLDPTKASLFAVGKKAVMTAFAVQASGDPAHQYYEYVTPTAINTVGGNVVITLAAPLTLTYLSTFPNYDAGSSGQPDQGGPATLYTFPDNWYASIEFRAVTFDIPVVQTYCKLQNATFINCVVVNTNSLIPTMNENWIIRGAASNWAGIIEVDKFLGTVTVDQGATVAQLYHQTPSPAMLIVDAATAQLNGTPRQVIVRNGSNVAISPGTNGWGHTESIEVSSSTVTALTRGSTAGFGTFAGLTSVVNGLMTVPKSYNTLAAMAPGLKMFRDNAGLESQGGFRVSDMTETGPLLTGNTLIYTNLPGAGPSLPPLPGHGSTLEIGPHPCARMRFTAVTGCEEALNLSNAGAYDRPLFSYGLWTCSGLSGNSIQRDLWGIVKSIKVNVTSAAAGTLNVLSALGNYPVILADSTRSTFAPTVNLASSGLHTIDLSGGPYWFTGPVTPNVSGTTTASFTIEIITDPGIGRTFACTFA